MKIIDSLAPQQIHTDRDRLAAIYRHAFKAPPYSKTESEVAEFAHFLPYHMGRAGFRMVVAIDGEADEIVGFAYGFANTPEQLFHQEVAKVVSPHMVTDWLLHSFRLVEMAVTPNVQGQGVGGALHNHLFSRLSYKKAVLATIAAETTAYRLYCKRGWRLLVEEMFFPNVARPYQVMGLELEDWD